MNENEKIIEEKKLKFVIEEAKKYEHDGHEHEQREINLKNLYGVLFNEYMIRNNLFLNFECIKLRIRIWNLIHSEVEFSKLSQDEKDLIRDIYLSDKIDWTRAFDINVGKGPIFGLGENIIKMEEYLNENL